MTTLWDWRLKVSMLLLDRELKSINGDYSILKKTSFLLKLCISIKRARYFDLHK